MFCPEKGESMGTYSACFLCLFWFLKYRNGNFSREKASLGTLSGKENGHLSGTRFLTCISSIAHFFDLVHYTSRFHTFASPVLRLEACQTFAQHLLASWYVHYFFT